MVPRSFFAGGNSDQMKIPTTEDQVLNGYSRLRRATHYQSKSDILNTNIQRRSGHIWHHTDCQKQSFTGTPESSSSEMWEFVWYFVGFIDEKMLYLYTSDLRLHVRCKPGKWPYPECIRLRYMDAFYLSFALYLVFVGGTMNRTPASKSKMRFYLEIKCFCFMVGGWNIWSPVF